jgi:hypothetical protein
LLLLLIQKLRLCIQKAVISQIERAISETRLQAAWDVGYTLDNAKAQHYILDQPPRVMPPSWKIIPIDYTFSSVPNGNAVISSWPSSNEESSNVSNEEYRIPSSDRVDRTNLRFDIRKG